MDAAGASSSQPPPGTAGIGRNIHPPPPAAEDDNPREWFKAGVAACLRSWSALRMAVESEWGGTESLAKAEELRVAMLRLMDFRSCPPKSLDLVDLEDNLAIYLEEEFSVVLEDASERQVAETIWRLYERCYHGDVALARHLVAQAEAALAVAASHPSQIQSTEHDDDEDDEDEEMIDADNGVDATTARNEPSIGDPYLQELPTPPIRTSTVTSAREYANQPLFGASEKKKSRPVSREPVRQLGEAAPAARSVQVDEDGFATVPVRRQAGRKPG